MKPMNSTKKKIKNSNKLKLIAHPNQALSIVNDIKTPLFFFFFSEEQLLSNFVGLDFVHVLANSVAAWAMSSCTDGPICLPSLPSSVLELAERDGPGLLGVFVK